MKFGYQHQLSHIQVVSSALLTWYNLILLTSCSVQSTYYVTPTPDTPCPGEPCHTLSQYVADQHFSNLPVNTTMEFLPGNHTLVTTISVTNLAWFTLHGNSSSLPEITGKIVCAWPAGFVFTSITELHISSLAFISCGHSDSAAVTITSVQQSNILNCSFHASINNALDFGSYGGALYVQNSNVILTGSIFQNNSADLGGVLDVWNSNLTVTNNTFQNNSADWGGVLDVWNSNLTVTNNTFQNNSADWGGVLDVGNSNLTVTNNTFQNNCADRGGVLDVWNSNLTVTDNTFQSNKGGMLPVWPTATGYTFWDNKGGLFHVKDSTLTVTDNSFQSNSANFGGVLFVWNSTLTVTDNTFQDNSANKRGVLNVRRSNLTVTDNTFQNNSANKRGVLNVQRSNLTVTDNTFQNNSANWGGVLKVWRSTLTVTDNAFQNNSANRKGVLCVWNSTLTVTDNTFQNNSANRKGVLYVWFSTLTVINNTFQNNSAYRGGVLYALDSSLIVTDNTFQNNFAHGGGVLYVQNSTLTVTDNAFQTNFADSYGGVLYVGDSTLTVTDNTFQNNSAAGAGGVLSIRSSTVTSMIAKNTFQNNSASMGGILYMEACSIIFTDNSFTDSSADYGGAIFVTDNSMVSMYGNNLIQNNRAQYGGGIAALNSQLQLRNTIFENNKAIFGGGLYTIRAWYGGGSAALNSRLQLLNTIFENNRASFGGGLYAQNIECNGNALFNKNFAFGGGGIYASRSIFFWSENTTTIKNNSAVDGGGLLLFDGSKLYLQPNITVQFISNSASNTGGAVKVEENNQLTYCSPFTNGYDVSNSDCFFQIQSQMKQEYITDKLEDFINVRHIMIHFEKNSAVEAGTDLYGGNVDNCTLSNVNMSYSGPSPSGYVFDVITNSGNKPIVFSKPLDICTCVANQMECTGSYHPKPVYPGETLEVPVITPGQRNGGTLRISVVQVIDTSNKINVSNLQISQNIYSSCTSLKYTIQSLAVDTTQEMTLYAEGPCPPTDNNTLTVTVDILSCPPGFQLSETQSSCICAKRLHQFTNTCSINTATVLRVQDAEFWVGYSESRGLILHPHCPFDYCTSKETHLAVYDSDKQCSYNRSGLLCGRCGDNLSLALGSSRCLQCSNSYLSLLAAFAFAGIALVVFLLVLRLTVAAGTINGLIFYANVVAVNSAIFFQRQTTNVLTVFIAWLNLDLGIETCFYNGMDAYVKTWLQFAFPLYVWALVGMIIIGSYYSGRVARMFGSNPVAVLATLFLLSYAKLLRTCIAALSYTSLQYPNNSHIAVWLYDGNIRYLSGKHIPLFTAAMVCLIFLVLPYTMLLISGQWLQAKSQLKIFSYVNSRYFKPFLDAYHAPCMDKHRYWNGLMLLLRLVFFLIFAVNALGDPSVNLLATGSTTAAILAFTILNTRIYQTFSLVLLETSFILNLTILSVATLYIHLTRGNQNAATFTSVGIAFATFVGIVIYHSVQQLKDTPWLRKVLSKLSLSPMTPGDTPEKKSGMDYEDSADRPVTAPTTTVVDLCELNSYMLREPCMETNQ